MSPNYSSYHEIDPTHISLFEHLWGKYEAYLPTLPTNIQNERNTKAAVFNLWVNFYNVENYLILNSDKSFLHAYDEHLSKRLKMFIPRPLSEAVESYASKSHHSFIYCYLLIFQVFQELTAFVEQHDKLDAPTMKNYNYYYTKDDDFSPNNELFKIMKILNSEFIQLHLSKQKCEYMHYIAYNQLDQYLQDEKGVSEH